MITYLEAIRLAQQKALATDPRVFLYGQDIGNFGGAFKATKNLAAEFPGRVLDAPLSEDAIVGMAIGAAIEGARPIVEMQFADFSTCGLNQIVNHAGTLFYRTGVPCPIVVRLPSGGTSGGGPFHSQSLEAIYAHWPGLVVVTPATVEDAYTMLLEAVALDDPVVFCEHKFLYYHLKAESLPETSLPIGKARIAHSGSKASIVTYGAAVHWALKTCEAGNLDAEVIDLRTLLPWDKEAVAGSVKKTGRVLLQKNLAPEYFGEGIAELNGKLYQLTWKNQVGFVYDAKTLKKINELYWPYEGWGLTHNDTSLIVSTGESNIYFIV